MKLKKKTLKVLIPLIIILLIALYFYNPKPKDPYQFEGNTLDYSEKRPPPDYEMSLNSTFEN